MEFSNKNSSYVEQIQSKNAMNVSVFTDGKTFYSRYNPQHDAEIFCENEIFENSDFFLIAGLGNGYHIQELVKKFPKKKILVLEDNSSSIETLFFQNQNLNYRSSRLTPLL